jgi:hypothetical protein
LYLVSILQLKLFYQDPIEYVQLITPLTQKQTKLSTLHIFHVTLREKEVPHEQAASALGFFNIRKAVRISSDW